MIEQLSPLNIILGSSVVALLIKELFAYRRKTAETTGINITNADARLGNIRNNSDVMNELLDDSEASVKKMRELNAQINTLESENADLTQALNGSKRVIEYQKEERHEWTLLLEKLLKREAESQLKIEQLEKRVEDLEGSNELLKKSQLRDVGEGTVIHETGGGDR